MSKSLSRGLYLVLFTGGLTLLGAGVANAADTTGDDGLLSGTQIVAPISAPVEVVGNAVSVLGDVLAAPAAAPAPAPVPAAVPEPVVAPVPVAAPVPAPVPTTSGSDSVLGGTQAVVDVVAPVTVGGNAISVLGDAASTGAATPATPAAPAAGAVGSGSTTSGADGIAGGTQLLPSVAIPVTVGGNAISLLGDAASTGAATPATPTAPAAGAVGSGSTTSGAGGILSGTQLVPNIALPITVADNAISILGASTTQTAGLPSTPATPVIPVIPGTPVTPVTPATPGFPAAPVTPGTSGAVTLAATVATDRAGTSSVAAISAQQLAYTGVEIVPVLGLVAALVIAGVGLALLGRRTA